MVTSNNKGPSVKIFGVRFDKMTMDEAFHKFVSFVGAEQTQMIFTPNSEIVMKAQEDVEFLNVLNSGHLVIPDGIGVILASKIHRLGLSERIPGIEMMGRMLAYCHRTERSVYLFGGQPGVAEKAAERIKATYPNIQIKGVASGYYDASEASKILDDINEKKPDILFVALGAPKQEKWIYQNEKLLNVSVAMGVGGALDVWAGNVKRAPKLFCKMGLEWFYRLMVQPSRFFRMLVLPKFMFKVLLTRNIEQKL